MIMPIRTCTGCRATAEKAELVRLVADKAGRVKVDDGKRMPGRGAYVHKRLACLEDVVKNGGFSKAFRRNTQPLDVARLWSSLNGEEGSRA